MAVYGKTWWGKKWLEAFTDISDDNRLPRGRTYANTGRAHNIKIDGNFITAKVQGSRPRPYNVTIELEKFNNSTQKEIQTIINDSLSIQSALLNRRLPNHLMAKLSRNKLPWAYATGY